MPFLGIAQQLPQFSQYMFNTVSINPAYAGTRERLNVTLLNRNQWVGIKGGPVTQTLSVDSAIPETNLGLGLSVVNDKLGYEGTTYIYADFSYSISINDDYRLSFGLKAGASKYSIDTELLNDPDAQNDIYLDQLFNRWKPNFGAGIYYRSREWFVSLSTPRLITYTNDTNIDYQSFERSSYYLMGGAMLNLNKKLKMKPTFLVKYTNGAPLSYEFTANFLINDQLWLGAAYRFKDALGAMVNFQVTENLKIGYAYEFNTSDIRPYTSGSHEIFINYQFELPWIKCNCNNVF